MTKRYLLFAGGVHNRKGGMGDFIGSFESVYDACLRFDEICVTDNHESYWFHILCSETMSIVKWEEYEYMREVIAIFKKIFTSARIETSHEYFCLTFMYSDGLAEHHIQIPLSKIKNSITNSISPKGFTREILVNAMVDITDKVEL